MAETEMTTAKQIADKYRGRGSMPTFAVEQMYRLRDAEVAVLAERSVIGVHDILGLERTGRFLIASTLFAKCDDSARKALLQDQHHGVRSAAAINARGL